VDNTKAPVEEEADEEADEAAKARLHKVIISCEGNGRPDSRCRSRT
jgi:hypothetical protein